MRKYDQDLLCCKHGHNETSKKKVRRDCLIFITFIVFTLFGLQASANLITVNAQFGQPGCDLSEAILSANSNLAIGGCLAGSSAGTGEDEILITLDSINFDDASIVYDNTFGGTGLPYITSKISISSTSISTLIREASDPRGFRFFVVRENGDLSLTNLSLQGGIANKTTDFRAASGGAIFTECNTKLNLEQVELRNNQARYGGAIAASRGACGTQLSQTRISRSLFHNNSASTDIANNFTSTPRGGAISIGTQANVSIIDSTITGNSGRLGGGVACPTASFNTGCNLSIINSTITDNSEGGGIYLAGFSSGAGKHRLTLRNSIVSGNTTPDTRPEEINVSFPASQLSIMLFNNVIGDDSKTVAEATNLSSLANNVIAASNTFTSTPLNQILGPLANNGGSFLSHELTPNSPALNEGVDYQVTGSLPIFFFEAGCRNTSLLAGPLDFRKDQNGKDRPIGEACDIGAIESRYGEEDTCYVAPLKNSKTVVFCL